jgi:hypothetical protein
VLLIFTINRIYLDPLLGEIIGCHNVVNELPAPPRHVVKKSLRGQEQGRDVVVNGDLRAQSKSTNLEQFGKDKNTMM